MSFKALFVSTHIIITQNKNPHKIMSMRVIEAFKALTMTYVPN